MSSVSLFEKTPRVYENKDHFSVLYLEQIPTRIKQNKFLRQGLKTQIHSTFAYS